MNRLTRFWKTAYRQEPISSFVLTIGLVDAVIGGVGGRGSLLLLGLTTVGVAIALRRLLMRRPELPLPQPVPQRYLPARSSRPSLPLLGLSEKHD
ncbi:MAG: hypothetical protein EDM05_009810 [Leptolyngbya sp. IPPAS B-1204]|nr:hypothetical protein [Elainella sp. C42_A2020_010]RNJ66451.1 MAG: hypothetical protein EDM05_25215 [Leptolyngbya sp. IPPAS B-1204]